MKPIEEMGGREQKAHNQVQNPVVSTKNEWGGKGSEESRSVRGLKDFPQKRDPGMGCLGWGEQ